MAYASKKVKMSKGSDYGKGSSGTQLLKPNPAYCGPGRKVGKVGSKK